MSILSTIVRLKAILIFGGVAAIAPIAQVGLGQVIPPSVFDGASELLPQSQATGPLQVADPFAQPDAPRAPSTVDQPGEPSETFTPKEPRASGETFPPAETFAPQQPGVPATPDDPIASDAPIAPNEPAAPEQSDSFRSLANLQLRTQKIIAQSIPAVVAIDETGSGVIVSPNGIVLTASHVTRFANRRVSVALSDGRVVQGVTLGSNFAADTGAIQLLSPGPYPFISVKDSKDAKQGSWCIAMGYPLSFPRGVPATGRLGRVLNRESNGKLVTDCTIMGGDSGGPLLNLEGKVIAISSSVKLGIDQNLHIPSERFIVDWKNIAMSIDRTSLQTNTQIPPEQKEPSAPGFKITKRPSGKAYLGVNAETDQNIVRIRAVHRQSPAEFAGIQANDVIMEIDSAKISSFAQMVKLLRTRKPGEQILVVLNRYGSLLQTNVTLGGTIPRK